MAKWASEIGFGNLPESVKLGTKLEYEKKRKIQFQPSCQVIFARVEHSDERDSMYVEFVAKEEKVENKFQNYHLANHFHKPALCQECPNVHSNI